MPSPKLELARKKLPGTTGLLDAVANYVRKQLSAGEDYITPKLMGAELKISDGEAFVLLKLLASTGLLTQQFNVYCKAQGMFMTSVDSLNALDQIDHCEFCDEQHQPGEYSVEVAFRPAKGIGVSDLAA